MCTTGSASLITCYLWCYKWYKINCFSTFEVKLASYEAVWKWNQRWLMAHRSVLLTRADLHSWGSDSAPALSVSPVIYAQRERLRGWEGRLDLMGTCCSNNEWPLGLCVCVRETVHREQKACSLWGIDFYLWHDVTFPSVTPAVLCVRPRFSSPRFSKMQMDLSAFLSNKERNQDRVEALFVCHHTMTFLLISGPAAR